LSVNDLLKFELSQDQYTAHIRVQEKGRDLVHSVTISGIDYHYNSIGDIVGVNKIHVANPLSDYGSFYSKTSYKMNEIVRWDIFKVTHLNTPGYGQYSSWNR
jgi:hypothetical protein